MVLTLYGLSGSTSTQRAALVLTEKQVPFKFKPIDFAKGENKSPAYLQFQPFGQVPYIDDDGLILYESRAIARYVATKYADQGTQGLLPTAASGTIEKYAKFEQAVSVEQHHFDPPVSSAIFENLFKSEVEICLEDPYHGGVTDPKIFDKHIATLSAKLDVYDKILANQKYLAGDEVTLADLFHVSSGSMLFVAGSNIIDTKSNVARWWKDITSRPAWIAVKDGLEKGA